MPALAAKPKLASGEKTSVDAVRINEIAYLVADLPRESVAANDELASDQNVYSYVNNNPLSFTDPTGQGLFKSIRRVFKSAARSVRRVVNWGERVVDRYGKTAVAAVAAYYTWGYTAWGTGSYVAAGAASGAVGGGIAGGNLKSAAYGAVGGGITGGFADSSFLGQATGSGINGYLQTGNSEGFLRGFVSGGIPQDLGFTNAYNTYGAANIGIGIARDAARGYVVGGREGIVPGIGYGQFNNAVGHLVGFTTSGFSSPQFKNGAFVYEGSWWEGRGAITFGNVVSGPTGLADPSSMPERYKNYLNYRSHLIDLQAHEFGHIPQGNYLGAAYIPSHGLFMGASLAVTGYTHSQVNLLEEGFHPFPSSSIQPLYVAP